MRFAPQGIPKITEWKKRIGNIPLVAIGGIKLEQAAEIFAAGADSIAVVSDVTQNADPDARVRHGSARTRRPRDEHTRIRHPAAVIRGSKGDSDAASVRYARTSDARCNADPPRHSGAAQREPNSLAIESGSTASRMSED